MLFFYLESWINMPSESPPRFIPHTIDLVTNQEQRSNHENSTKSLTKHIAKAKAKAKMCKEVKKHFSCGHAQHVRIEPCRAINDLRRLGMGPPQCHPSIPLLEKWDAPELIQVCDACLAQGQQPVHRPAPAQHGTTPPPPPCPCPQCRQERVQPHPWAEANSGDQAAAAAPPGPGIPWPAVQLESAERRRHREQERDRQRRLRESIRRAEEASGGDQAAAAALPAPGVAWPAFPSADTAQRRRQREIHRDRERHRRQRIRREEESIQEERDRQRRRREGIRREEEAIREEEPRRR